MGKHRFNGRCNTMSDIRTFFYSFVFSVLNGVRMHARGGQSLLLVSTDVSKFLFLRL